MIMNDHAASSKLLITQQNQIAWKPNFFIAFRLSGSEIYNAVTTIQQRLKQKNNKLKRCLTSAKKLHFTLFVLQLNDVENIE